MENKKSNTISRNRFLLLGAALLTATGLIKFWNPFKTKDKKTEKFLTQDGQLVSVDTKHLEAHRTKIFTSEIKTWIKQ